MAIDKRLQIFDDEGNPVDYDILASDVKFNDGKDLPTKLDEMEEEIDGAGGYTPPAGGIPKTDLAQDVQTSLGLADTALQASDKSELQTAITNLQNALNTLIGSGNVQGAIDTFNEVTAFLNGIDTSDPTLKNQLLALSNAITALQTALNTKANSSEVVKSITVNGQTQTPQNGNVNIEVQAGDQVSVSTNNDGTFTIHAGENDYTINLNHTHEGMAKLVVCEESDLPSTLDNDTIYALVNDAEPPTEIQSLWIAGLEFVGGASPSGPRLIRPTDGREVNLNTVNGTASYELEIKAKNLTQPLVVEFGNGSTGYSFDTSNLPTGVTYDSNTGKITITKEAACTINGVKIVVVYTGSDTDEDAAGALGISSVSADGINAEVTLITNKVVYENLAAVKTTGKQYVVLDYHPNPNTKLEIDMQFERNSNEDESSSNNVWFSPTPDNTVGAFSSNFGPQKNEIYYWVENGYVSNVWKQTYGNIYSRSVFVYNNNVVTFLGLNTTTEAKTTTQDGKLLIGGGTTQGQQVVFNRHNIIVYSIKISEGGTVLLNLVPKSRNGIPGLYDIKNDKFYTSETSDDLEAV